jgi:hypothetical protein
MKNEKGNNQSSTHNVGSFTNHDNLSTNLEDSGMMAHLLAALHESQDIGDYGRLTFVIVGRHFMRDDEIIDLIAQQPGFDEESAKALLVQVNGRDYNPPKRQKILEWQAQQDFQICPDDDPNGCNVYRELKFPDEVYERIEEFWEEKAGAQDY